MTLSPILFAHSSFIFSFSLSKFSCINLLSFSPSTTSSTYLSFQISPFIFVSPLLFLFFFSSYHPILSPPLTFSYVSFFLLLLFLFLSMNKHSAIRTRSFWVIFFLIWVSYSFHFYASVSSSQSYLLLYKSTYSQIQSSSNRNARPQHEAVCVPSLFNINNSVPMFADDLGRSCQFN